MCNRIKDECCQVLSVWCLLPVPMPLGVFGSLELQAGRALVKSLAFEASQTEVSLGPITDSCLLCEKLQTF